MPVDEESLIRHCSLDCREPDLIQAKRAAHNRLGLAIQLCYLNNRGRTLLPGEEPPASLVVFIARQIGVNPDVLAAYSRRDTNRREHAVEVSGIFNYTRRLVMTGGRPWLGRSRPRLQPTTECR